MPELGPPGALSPSDWNSIVNYDAWRDFFTPDDAVALHHGGGTNYAAGNPPYTQAKEIQQLQQWEGFHLYSKGWRGLAYGWAIGQTGTIYRIRGWNTYGAHTGDLDGDGISNNTEVIPVLFIGSGSHVALTGAARAALRSLRIWLEAESGRSLKLYGHQELRGTVTSCPGPKLMAYVKDNRNIGDDDMVDRKTAVEPNPALLGNVEEARQAGIFSEYTQPGGVIFADELATFFKRAGLLTKGARTWTRKQIAAIAAGSAAGGATASEVIQEIIKRLG